MITWEQFEAIDIRTGTIIEAEVFEGARKPAYKLKIDFGDLGIKKSSAQITDCYKPEALLNMQIVAVINFPPKQIANFISECLVLGVVKPDKKVVLLTPTQNCDNGLRIA
jgi:tRNA-binding protein